MQLFIVSLLALSLQWIPSANSQFELEVLLISYQNPDNLLFTGQCCEISQCGGICDNAFIFCIRKKGSDRCDIARYTTGLIENDNDDLSFSQDEAIGYNDMQNPIVISGDESPEEVEIKIKIYDLDGGSFNKQAGSDLVAGFWIHPDVRRLPSGVFSEHFSYRNHTSTIVLAYNLTCIQPYHGANCFNPKSSTVSPSFTGVLSSTSKPSQTSSSLTPKPPNTTAARPKSPNTTPTKHTEAQRKETIPLSVSLAVNCIVVVGVVAVIVAVTTVVCFRRFKRRKTVAVTHSAYDVMYKPGQGDVKIKSENDTHIYDTINPYSTVAPKQLPAPTISAMNPTYSVLEDGLMELENNVAYDILKVERNAAYDVQSCALPDVPNTFS